MVKIMKKYFIDPYGKQIISECQTGRRGEALYDPQNESLEKFPNYTEGKTCVLKNGKWEIVDDIRGTYWNKQSKQELKVHFHTVEKLKELEGVDISEYTKIEPASSYDEWDGKKWVTDEAKQDEELWFRVRMERDQLLNDFDIVYCNSERWSKYTEVQKQLCTDYKKALKDIPQNFSNPLTIIWPEIPILP